MIQAKGKSPETGLYSLGEIYEKMFVAILKLLFDSLLARECYCEGCAESNCRENYVESGSVAVLGSFGSVSGKSGNGELVKSEYELEACHVLGNLVVNLGSKDAALVAVRNETGLVDNLGAVCRDLNFAICGERYFERDAVSIVNSGDGSACNLSKGSGLALTGSRAIVKKDYGVCAVCSVVLDSCIVELKSVAVTVAKLGRSGKSGSTEHNSYIGLGAEFCGNLAAFSSGGGLGNCHQAKSHNHQL